MAGGRSGTLCVDLTVNGGVCVEGTARERVIKRPRGQAPMSKEAGKKAVPPALGDGRERAQLAFIPKEAVNQTDPCQWASTPMWKGRERWHGCCRYGRAIYVCAQGAAVIQRFASLSIIVHYVQCVGNPTGVMMIVDGSSGMGTRMLCRRATLRLYAFSRRPHVLWAVYLVAAAGKAGRAHCAPLH